MIINLPLTKNVCMKTSNNILLILNNNKFNCYFFSYLKNNLPWLFCVFDPFTTVPHRCIPHRYPSQLTSHLAHLSLAPGVWVPSFVALPCTLRVWKKAWRRSVRWPCSLDRRTTFRFVRTNINLNESGRNSNTMPKNIQFLGPCYLDQISLLFGRKKTHTHTHTFRKVGKKTWEVCESSRMAGGDSPSGKRSL